jgi:NADH-quinone oxidoreductase subunit C
MRYDATLEKVIYEPVDIEPRISVPKVIREEGIESQEIKECAHD